MTTLLQRTLLALVLVTGTAFAGRPCAAQAGELVVRRRVRQVRQAVCPARLTGV